MTNTTTNAGFTAYEAAGLARNCPLALQAHYIRRTRVREGLRRNDLTALHDALTYDRMTRHDRPIDSWVGDVVVADEERARERGGWILPDIASGIGWDTPHGDDGRARRAARARAYA